MKIKIPALLAAGAGVFSCGQSMVSARSMTERPNILLVVCEDISPYLGCYGDSVAVTPNLDLFSEQSVRHSSMFTCVGVSSPSRYSLITGRYPSADGANYMRVNLFNKTYETVPPEGVKCFTEFLRRDGYYCTNNSKTDYQFSAPVAAWDENGAKAHWKHAPEDRPFFSIFNLNVTHESQIWKNTDRPLLVDPEDIIVPPYYPDTPVVRHDMAVMYSNIALMDAQFRKLLDELEASPRAGNTVVIFYSDNGGPLPRGKREIMDSGSRVPFMVRFPEGYGAGTVCNDLNMFVDIPATILSIAGVEPPSYMHGQPMYGKYKSLRKRKYVFGAADRFDEQVEKRGSIRTDRYLYIRNYMPDQSVYRPVSYRLSMAMMREMSAMYEDGRLDGVQSIWFNPEAAEEELYDCVRDPHNIENLAERPEYERMLRKMRRAYSREWIVPYNKEWETYAEDWFVSRNWPGGTKPLCEKPLIRKRDGIMDIVADPDVFSVSYRREGERKWELYTGPFEGKSGELVRIRVERIGFVPYESEESFD